MICIRRAAANPLVDPCSLGALYRAATRCMAAEFSPRVHRASTRPRAATARVAFRVGSAYPQWLYVVWLVCVVSGSGTRGSIATSQAWRLEKRCWSTRRRAPSRATAQSAAPRRSTRPLRSTPESYAADPRFALLNNFISTASHTRSGIPPDCGLPSAFGGTVKRRMVWHCATTHTHCCVV